jgi:cellulose synthase/poly-beta-1,6-N-acetylglucosamine synthase-like glycosyltransferase
MITLIISLYKRLDFLNLVLQGVERQSYRDFEVIIAEDDNATETIDFLEQARKQYTYPIKHVSQEDAGFRKTKILNAAIVAAAGEQIAIIDGDCIPHKYFLKKYAKAIRKNKICYGRRSYLSEKLTTRLLQEKSIRNLTFFKAYCSGSTYMGAAIYNPFFKNIDKQRRGILGCNWGILREHLISINGFDEDYNAFAVGEDNDIEWRLKTKFRMKSMKNKAIVYHIEHGHAYVHHDDISTMQHLLTTKIKAGNVYCVNGINKKI